MLLALGNQDPTICFEGEFCECCRLLEHMATRNWFLVHGVAAHSETIQGKLRATFVMRLRASSTVLSVKLSLRLPIGHLSDVSLAHSAIRFETKNERNDQGVNSNGIRDLWTVLTELTVLTGLTADVVDLVNPYRVGTVPGFLVFCPNGTQSDSPGQRPVGWNVAIESRPEGAELNGA